jgi:S1-C subfamily serine protease
MENETCKFGENKFLKIFFFILVIFVIGGIGGAFVDRYLFPKLSQYPFFSKCSFLMKANESVTIIEKTEQVMVKDEDSIGKIIARPASGMVNILSFANGKSKNGSGFIVTSDGLVVTYLDAIISDNAEYRIYISDGSEYVAELAGIDNYSNLAYFKIPKSNLPIVSFVNSDEVGAGKKIIVIGNSTDEYQNQLTYGIVRSFENTFNLAGKTISFSDKLEGVFKFSGEIADDFIGGVAVDYNGDAIGVIGKLTIDNKNQYFIIPSNEVNRSIDLVIDNKIKERGTLGVYYIPLSKSYSTSAKIDQKKGALIFSPSGKQGLAILSGSNGEKAKLILGDIIISVDGKEVDSNNPLSEIISRYKKGEKGFFHLMRGGKLLDIEVNF